MQLLSKLKFLLKKPKIIIVAGNGRKTAREAIFQVLRRHFKVGDEILVFELINATPVEKFNFLIKNSSLPILLITHFGDIPPDRYFFAGERRDFVSSSPSFRSGEQRDFVSSSPSFRSGEQRDFVSSSPSLRSGERKDISQAKKLAKILPAHGYLIVNFDDEAVREIKKETNLKEITFGFQEGADFRATDINLNTQALAKGGDEATASSTTRAPAKGGEETTASSTTRATAKGGDETLVSSTIDTNFKINYKGNIVPVWLENLFGKEQIYSALSAAVVGTVLGLNLVEISNALKNYQGLPGKV